MLHVVLHQPEIPPNTGNVIRLAANCGAQLHLVQPLGFRMEDRLLRRAGLDYHEHARVMLHPDWPACRAWLGRRRLFALTTRARRVYAQCAFDDEDAFVFGAETSGLPQAILDEFPEERRLRIPMRAGSRSLNLSNAVAVVVMEAWRQGGFAGAG
ncbi:MAG: tRNA (cytidine(34)-2'-O)-methyltransferase [Burkholderiales bacterium]|nr:tRNA (cytidine(34)-2'-O)-methyltransferase [Burkholderiales bacterium]